MICANPVILWKTVSGESLHGVGPLIGQKIRSAMFSTTQTVGNVENFARKTLDFSQFPKGFPQPAAASAMAFPHVHTVNYKILKNFRENCEHCGKREKPFFGEKRITL